MKKISEYVVLKLIKNCYIKEDDKEWYMYVVEQMVEKWLAHGMLIILSIYFNMLFPTLLFMICFLSLRRRTGGFHMNTFGKCFLTTSITYILMVKVLFPYFEDNLTQLYILLLISICYIYIVGAVNHPNMDWNKAEYMESKKISRTLVIFEGVGLVSLILLNANISCITFFALGIILCAFSLFLAKIFKQQVRVDTV